MKNNNKGDDIMIDTLRNNIDRFRAMRVRQKSRYWQATAEIPATLYPYWKRSAQFEFKGIPRDAFFFARATEGLLTFFDCMRASGKPCALPSAAADSVWHAWMQDGAGLAGRLLHQALRQGDPARRSGGDGRADGIRAGQLHGGRAQAGEARPGQAERATPVRARRRPAHAGRLSATGWRRAGWPASGSTNKAGRRERCSTHRA